MLNLWQCRLSVPFHATLLASTVAVSVTACGDASTSDASRPNTTVRDSAGIEIVENALPDDQPVALTVSDEPIVSIGTVEGDEASQLHRVRDALRMPDGRIAILNAGTHEVRIYREDGTLDVRFGGQGDGPGEFSGSPWQLTLLPPDTLVVFDARTWEVSLFLDDGTFLEKQPGRTRYEHVVPEDLRAEGGFASPGSGLFLKAYRFGRRRPAGERFIPEMHLIFASRDSTVRELLEPGGSEQVMLEREAGRPASTTIRFGKRGMTAFGGRPLRVWAGRNDRYELHQFDGEGNPLRIIRADRDPLRVTEEDVERLNEQARRSIADAPIPEDRKQEALDRLLSGPVADSIPVFGSVDVTVDGGAWIGRTGRPPAHDEEWVPEYDVFGPGGRWQGLVRGVLGVIPQEIGTDYLLGLRRDDLGVEHVELYELRETGSFAGRVAPVTAEPDERADASEGDRR